MREHQFSMKKILKCLLFFAFYSLSSSIYAQLVNIESQRMQTDSIRFVLKNDFSFSYNNNDGSYLYQISNGLSSQLKSKDLKKIYFLIGNYDLIRSSDQDFRNSWMLHFRFNYKLNDLFRLESFIQSQHNELLYINRRNLVGAGVRFKIISKENVSLYIANASMYEEEKSKTLDKRFYHLRNSSYLSFTATISKSNVKILNTIYFQPLYKSFSNHRILEQLKIEVPINKHLNLNSMFNYYYDSKTPDNNKQYTANISVGIGFQL